MALDLNDIEVSLPTGSGATMAEFEAALKAVDWDYMAEGAPAAALESYAEARRIETELKSQFGGKHPSDTDKGAMKRVREMWNKYAPAREQLPS